MDAFSQLMFLDATTESPLEYMASSWCQPDQPSSVLDEQIDSFLEKQLRALIHACGLPVPKRHVGTYKQTLRDEIKTKVREYATAHPELFEDDAEEPTTPVAFAQRIISASVAAPSVAPPASVVLAPSVGAPVVPSRAHSSSGVATSIRQASAHAMNELPLMSRPSAATLSRRRAVPPQAHAAAAVTFPSRIPSRPLAGSVPPSSASHLSLLHDYARAPEQDTDYEEGDERDELEYAVGDRNGNIVSERDDPELCMEDLESALARQGVTAPFAPGFLANMRAAAGIRSTLDLYKNNLCLQHPWDKATAKHSKMEVFTIAQTIDALLAGISALGLEVLTRRLAAVQTGVENQNWELGRAWDMPSQRTSFVPENHLIRAIKTAARNKFVEKGDRGDGYGSSYSSRVPTTKKPTGSSKPRSGVASSGTDRPDTRTPSNNFGDRSSSHKDKKSGSTKK
jgi:hypothetical protein